VSKDEKEIVVCTRLAEISNVIIHSRSASLSFMIFIGFIFYEYREHLHIRDMDWKDIQGYLFGLGGTALFYILMGWL